MNPFNNDKENDQANAVYLCMIAFSALPWIFGDTNDPIIEIWKGLAMINAIVMAPFLIIWLGITLFYCGAWVFMKLTGKGKDLEL